MRLKILSKLRRKPIGYIIVHPAKHETCEYFSYDVVVRKDKYDTFKRLGGDDLYTADCKYWKVFLKENKDYKYLGSEDFMHTFWGNIGSLGTLTWLIEKGFKLVAMDEEYLEKGEWVD